MTSPRLVIVTNIPSPYRIHEFRVLNQVLASEGIAFEVLFLAHTEKGRHWQPDLHNAGFACEVLSGWSIYVVGRPFLFNRGLLRRLRQHPPDWLIFGGSWYLPSIVLSAFAMQQCPDTTILGWNESTLADTHTIGSPFGRWLRSILVRPYDGWVVPGQRAAEFAQVALMPRGGSFVLFGNTVDESLYRDQVADLRTRQEALRREWGIAADLTVFLCAARLAPEKGILPFLQSIQNVAMDRCMILLAGDGPDRSNTEAWLAAHPQTPVRLLGHQDEAHLLELYALSDVLLLPSLSEPFGFVAVEALWAGLPLLLSDRIGALPEVLQLGENGWCFDPQSAEQASVAFMQAAALGRDALASMGRVSLQRAHDQFASDVCARRFVQALREL